MTTENWYGKVIDLLETIAGSGGSDRGIAASISGVLDTPSQFIRINNVETYRFFTAAYTLKNVVTSATVRFEGSLNGTTWFSLGESDTLTLTKNGTYSFKYQGLVKQVRFRFMAESGGSNTLIEAEIVAGNY